MQIRIEDLVEGVLQEMEAHGLTQSTIQQYRRGYYKPVIRYFAENNEGVYSLETLEFCQKKYEDSLFDQQIKQHHFQSMKRSLNYIREFAETGTVSFKPVVNTKVYLPSEKAVNLIEAALAATELKDSFKYKLHSIMRKFFCFIEDKNLSAENISPEVIKEFICFVQESNSRSMEYIVYCLRFLLNYLKSINAIDFKFDLNYFAPKSNRKIIISAFSEEEISKILRNIDTTTSIGKRNYAIILLACGTGLRGIDIINLKLTDINWKSSEVSIIQSKTGNPVKLPINGQISNAIADYILNGRPKSKCPNIFLRVNAPFVV